MRVFLPNHLLFNSVLPMLYIVKINIQSNESQSTKEKKHEERDQKDQSHAYRKNHQKGGKDHRAEIAPLTRS